MAKNGVREGGRKEKAREGREKKKRRKEQGKKRGREGDGRKEGGRERREAEREKYVWTFSLNAELSPSSPWKQFGHQCPLPGSLLPAPMDILT